LQANQSLLLHPNAACSAGKAEITNFADFGSNRPGLEPTIHRTQGEHTNHYTTDVVFIFIFIGATSKTFRVKRLSYLIKPR
jgi:hypothetical protein